MASSGKKNKKNKGTVISLQSFLSNGQTPTGTTQVTKKIRNVEGDESDDGYSGLPQVYQLPTAPRATRIFDDDSIPHQPPFMCYITNLPFDANEEDIYDFFGSSVISLRLPREDGESGRVRGFGYVEFETREDLIQSLSLPDPSIRGRRIRIDLSNDNDQQGGKNRNRRFDGFGNNTESRGDNSSNWRRDQTQEGAGYSSKERGYNRERRERSNAEENSAPGSWRTGDRPVIDFPQKMERGNEKIRDSNTRNKFLHRDDTESRKEDMETERPKLNLMPRTLPLPKLVLQETETLIDNSEKKDYSVQLPKKSGVLSEKVFGSAKPVDTASREMEIEERLAEARRQDKVRNDLDEEELIEQITDIHIDKVDKNNTNSAISWRRKDDLTNKPDEDRQRASQNIESGSNKIQGKFERPLSKDTREGNARDTNKKRETRNDHMKSQINPTGPVLPSSNKYSGLDDESSE